jgi:hypothetical protein
MKEILHQNLSLGLLLLLGLAALSGALRLDVLVVDCKSLVDLGLKSALILDAVTWLASGCRRSVHLV